MHETGKVSALPKSVSQWWRKKKKYLKKWKDIEEKKMEELYKVGNKTNPNSVVKKSSSKKPKT